jgi:hypothetical protein
LLYKPAAIENQFEARFKAEQYAAAEAIARRGIKSAEERRSKQALVLWSTRTADCLQATEKPRDAHPLLMRALETDKGERRCPGAASWPASHWLVDNEATATLFSYFATLLARAESDGHNPGYAQALHQAKNSPRNQAPWKRPYFREGFTIVGAK